MSKSVKQFEARELIVSFVMLVNLVFIILAITAGGNWWLGLIVFFPLLIIALANVMQRKHSLLRNYPLIGYFRYWLESIRPELRQYFFESDLDGKPFNRRQRSIVYQRSKNEKQTVAFGMQTDPNAPGTEWAAHSIYPVKLDYRDLRVWIGNKQCGQPYHCSIYNIGAMSYGALSKTAIQSLNEGAGLGGFAHNTGEGGISEYHLKGGDLIWQIGTGYFSCRDEAGNFNPERFKLKAALPQVKMIELKVSQGAKPGHGGILPAAKNTPEIAAIRNVTPNTTVYSPPAHTAFSNAFEMVNFLGKLRSLSGGKPVGFKICIGDKQEFLDICAAINSLNIIPDFISIDGAEGGTGAAPLEFTDNLGMPLYDAVAFVTQSLKKYRLKEDIKLIVSGKIITGFDILKMLALGADACYSARGMMLALGCIQALQCDSGKCPVGIATQNPKLYKGLEVTDKRARIASFHENTMKATAEIMEACGFKTLRNVSADKFFRRVDMLTTKSFEEMYFSGPLMQGKPPKRAIVLN